VLQSHHFRSGEELETTLHRYVSLANTEICVVSEHGRIVKVAQAASEPEELVRWAREQDGIFVAIGLEAGPLYQRLHRGLTLASLDVILRETRQVKGALKAMPVKTNRRDAEGIARLLHLVETFFKSIKAELIWRTRWETRRQTEGAIFQYINGFYNPRRRHSSLGGKIPLAFERKAA